MSVAPPVLRVLSLCSGVGMLDRGISIAHPGARVVGFCERDAYAAAVLVARMEDESLEQAPVWCGNLEDADWTAWRGAVDCVSAGFPCPPVSVAGQRKGTDDARWILPAIMRCVREVGAEWVFLENVGGLLSANAGREFGEVLRLLAESGFDAEWLVLPASDVGAPHERERVFFLAHALRLPSGERPGRERVLDDGSQVAESRRGAERQEQQERIGWGGGSAIARETGSSLVNPTDDHGRRGERGAEEGTRARGLGRRGPASASGSVADTPSGDGQREASRQGGHAPLEGEGMGDSERVGRAGDARRRSRSEPADGHRELADAGGTGREGREQRAPRNDGRGGRKHMDQLSNFAEHSPQVQAITKNGAESSPSPPTLRPRLNPAFVCALMGWPWWWTRAERISFGARETASWLSRQRALLRSFFGAGE